MIRRPPRSTLFPYTTLSRSSAAARVASVTRQPASWKTSSARSIGKRSEEHTSELQSPCNLVCRLLLEKKNGPMTHMPENYPPEHTKRSLTHLVRILRTTEVRTLILDHHILRDRDWKSRMVPVFEAGKEHDVAALTAPQFARKPGDPLEANRDMRHGIEPT